MLEVRVLLGALNIIGMKEIINIRLELDDAITYGEFDKAKDLIEQGLALSQDKELLGEIEYFKGQREILNQDFRNAIGHFDKAIQYNSSDGASYNDRALCMIEMGVIDEALDYFNRGIEVEPDFATIHHNKGWLLNKIGRHKEALECFYKAIELDNNRAVTYENIADTFMQLGDSRKALEFFNKALEALKPDYMQIREEILERIKTINQKEI